MRTALAPLLLLAAQCVNAQGAAMLHFDGSANLQAAPPVSTDGRFALSADLHPPALATATERFNINAAIRPGSDAKALATACGPITPDIFSNGFEN